MSLIKLNQVSKTFQDEEDSIQLLENINLSIEEDSINVIVGYSGSGKTTLLNIINGIEPISSGFIDKIDNLTIGYVTQQPSFIDELSVDKNLRFVASKMNNKDKIYSLMDKFNCSHLLKKKPYQLSGGEKQRINIIRGLLLNPNVLILDEPTASLDHDNKYNLINFIDEIQKNLKISIIMVTHDIEVISNFHKRKVFSIKNKSIEENFLL